MGKSFVHNREEEKCDFSRNWLSKDDKSLYLWLVSSCRNQPPLCIGSRKQISLSTKQANLCFVLSVSVRSVRWQQKLDWFSRFREKLSFRRKGKYQLNKVPPCTSKKKRVFVKIQDVLWNYFLSKLKTQDEWFWEEEIQSHGGLIRFRGVWFRVQVCTLFLCSCWSILLLLASHW